MKLRTSQTDYDGLPPLNQFFLARWKEKKGYPATKEFDFGQLVELALALTLDLHFDSPSDRTTFNNALHYEEINISWDGQEPIDILFYELNQKLKRRIFQYLIVFQSH